MNGGAAPSSKALPDSFLEDGEILRWSGGVNLPLLIRRQVRRLAWGAAVAAGMALAIWLGGANPALILIAMLIPPAQLVAQGIARRARERDIYVLTNRRVGIWSPPQGPAARMEGLELVAAGALMLPLEDLERIEHQPNALILHPRKGTGHFPLRLTDLSDPQGVADRITTALT